MPALGDVLSAYGTTSTNAATNASNTSKTSSTNKSSMDVNDFYTLLAAQLKYQDADNPMDTSQMVSMMVQTQMIEAITTMSSINEQQYAMNTISYASSMVGKSVTMAEMDNDGNYTGNTTQGVVTGMVMGENPTLYVNGKEYGLTQVMTVGSVPNSAVGDVTATTGTTTEATVADTTTAASTGTTVDTVTGTTI